MLLVENFTCHDVVKKCAWKVCLSTASEKGVVAGLFAAGLAALWAALWAALRAALWTALWVALWAALWAGGWSLGFTCMFFCCAPPPLPKFQCWGVLVPKVRRFQIVTCEG